MKKTLSSVISKIITSLFFICLPITIILSMQSCSIGLGDAVDTQVPTLSIQTPPVDAIIRDKFAVGGTWSDDGEIKEVKVVLKRNDSQSALIDNVTRDGDIISTLTFDGSVVQDKQGQGTWSSVINPFVTEKRIKDGKYEIQAIITDAAGHNTIQTRLITIDNTAPLIVLDRPASKEGTLPNLIDAYGQKLTLLGRAADDNNVDSIKINFFNDDKSKPVHTVTKTGVSNTIDETVALFRNPKDPNQDNIYYENYDKIYGSEKANTKTYTCSIEAYDKAQQYYDYYPCPSNSERPDSYKMGNPVNHYYLYKDLNKNLLQKYTITDLYRMLSNNYVSEDSRGVVQTVEQELDKLKVSLGQFTLNPENNPTFAISGFKSIENLSDMKNPKDFEIITGSRIAVDVAPGVDNNPLKEPFDGNYVVKAYPCIKNTITIDPKGTVYEIPIISSPEDPNPKFQGGSYKVMVPFNNTDIKEYKRYILKIEGKDEVGNELIPLGGEGKKYVFDFRPTGIPPKLTVSDTINKYYNDKENSNNILSFSGDISNADKTPELIVQIGREEGEEFKEEYSEILKLSPNKDNNKDKNKYLNLSDNGKSYEYKYTLDFSKDFATGLINGEKVLYITADCKDDVKTVEKYYFTFDSINPTGVPTTLDSKYESEGKVWFNSSQIKVKVSSITENGSGIESVEASYVSDANHSDFVTLTRRETKDEVYYDGFITVKDNGLSTIKFRITDKAGNINDNISLDVYVDTSSPISFDSSIKGTKLVNETNNGTNKLEIAISNILDNEKGSGINSVAVEKIGNKKPSPQKEYPVVDGSATIAVPSSLFGSGAVILKIKDNVGNIYTDTAFMMELDSKAPEVNIGTIFDADSSSKEKDVNGIFTISGTASDDKGLDKVVLSYKKKELADENENWKDLTVTGSANWSATINTKEIEGKDKAEYIFRVQAIDKAGNKSEIKEETVTVNQDSDRPIITLTTISVEGNSSTSPSNLQNSSTLYGMISDDDGDVSKLEYKTENKEWTEVPVVNGSWSIPKLEDGTQQLSFKVTEKGYVEGNVNVNSRIWTSSTGDTVNSPKIKGSDGKIINDGVLHLRVDTQPPKKQNEKYSIFGVIEGEPSLIFKDFEAQIVNKYGDFVTKAPTILGGIHNSLKVQIEVFDANGINRVEANLKSQDSKNILDSKSIVCTKVPKIKEDDINNDYETWEIEIKELQTLPSKNYILSYSVFDNSGLSNTSTLQFEIDNKAPIVDVLGPSSTSVSGPISIYGNVDSSSLIYYGIEAVPQDDNDLPNSIRSKQTNTDYKLIKDASLSWFVYFDGDIDESNVQTTHDIQLKEYITKIYEKTDGSEIPSEYDEFTPINLCIKAIDNTGNISTTNHKFIIDPKGDRPKVEILGPDNKSTVGGAVRIYGTAIDEKGSHPGVQNVWLQLISESHIKGKVEGKQYGTVGTSDSDYVLTKADLDYMVANGYEVYKMEGYKNEPGSQNVKLPEGELPQGETPYDYGALISFSGSSWSFKINENDELNPESGDIGKKGSNDVRFIIYAQDIDGELSKSNSRILSFDSDKPIISNLYLISEDGKAREYTEDMYISGNWKIAGQVTDKDKVNNIKILDSNNSEIKDGNLKITNLGTETVTFIYTLPTLSSEVGKYEFSVEAVDGVVSGDSSATASHTQTKRIVINVDNKAPELATKGSDKYRISEDVKQSNSFYTFGSRVTEKSVDVMNQTINQSGLAYVATYFVRESGDDLKIYNPLLSTSNTTIVRDLSKESNRDSYTSNSLSQNIVYDSGLYWLNETATQADNQLNVFTLSSIVNDNIHINSLVKINGTLYLVTGIDKSKNQITVNGNPKKTSDSISIMFANALIVDNPIQETGSSELNSNGYPTLVINDDGDGFVESANKSGPNWDWEANINSKNIPDGPIEIHYVAFDKAGNYSEDVVKTAFVSNNAPRIAGVLIKTDYNGDGTFSKDETIEEHSIKNNYQKYTPKVVENKDDVYKLKFDWDNNSAGNNPLPTAREIGKEKSIATLKDYTQIIPEIVGGNGKIYYGYDINKSNNKLPNKITKEGMDNRVLVTEGTKDSTVNARGTLNIQLGDLLKIGDSQKVPFKFTFWDSTESTIPFETSQKAEMVLYFDINAADESVPSCDIYNFDTTEKGLFYKDKSKSNKGEYDIDLSKGHVDIISSNTNVSGIVEILGTASDKKMINSLQLKIAGMPSSTQNSINDYHTVAEFSNGKLSSKKTDIEKDGYEFSILKEMGPNENGHTVDWKLVWNTEKLNPIVGEKSVVLKVFNKGIPKSGKSDVQTKNKSIDGETYYKDTMYQNKSKEDTYTVTVAPYITEVKTYLSDKKRNNPSVYNRTALGHYPVRSDETVEFKGFNLGDNNTLAISTLTNSGEYNFIVNEVNAINNRNTDTYAYNKKPNNDNNNLLNDNIIFDIWDIKVGATPKNGSVDEPIMHVNPQNGLVGFAFADSNSQFTMSNGQNSRCQAWQGNFASFNAVGFTYDANGVAHGTVAGADTYYNEKSAGRFSYFNSGWGPSDTSANGNYSDTNNISLESVAVPLGTVVKGTSTTDFLINEKRFTSPALATAVHTGGATSVYLAYYDALQGQIRFRVNSNSSTKTRQDDFVHKNYKRKGTASPEKEAFESPTSDWSLIAGKDWQQAETNGYFDTGLTAGKYVSLAVIPGTKKVDKKYDDKVLAVWYDGRNCLYAYNETPYSKNDMHVIKDQNGNYIAQSDSGWSAPKIIFTNGGRYCKIVVDADNHVHIAAYDNEGANVKYAHLDKYLSDYNETTDAVIVDSYNITGEEISIDVAKDANGNWIPYLSYYSPSVQGVRMAYLVPENVPKAAGGIYKAHGVNDNDEFTGYWEVTTVPTESSIKQDHVSIGVWRDNGVDDNGVDTKTKNQLKAIPKDKGGNDHATPIIAYGIERAELSTDAIETAQMR